ncbi:hypothetical protein HMPREF3155_08975 [Corynebacterium sp. HMSC06D04]|uniref:hypothetical protein n=1 Tax=Corynebacterium TaxID=1716 RepID=UPI0008A20DEF|nr:MULTISPECIES: hypothetical protein [Corynebacterium]MCK6160426.1 hypothetical protein [Corynebacterium simulans]OFT50257.1 hypothetical protein HMPREF3155_08975 [Corynebacterium sp. HMSC06D04]
MNRKDAARKRLLESAQKSAASVEVLSDNELATAAYRQLLRTIDAQSEPLDPGAAEAFAHEEIATMRMEKRTRTALGAGK